MLNVRCWRREICDQLWLPELFWRLRPSYWPYWSCWSYWNCIHLVYSEECTQSTWSCCCTYGSQSANQPKTATARKLMRCHWKTRLVLILDWWFFVVCKCLPAYLSALYSTSNCILSSFSSYGLVMILKPGVSLTEAFIKVFVLQKCAKGALILLLYFGQKTISDTLDDTQKA